MQLELAKLQQGGLESDCKFNGMTEEHNFVAQEMSCHHPHAGMEEARPKQGVDITLQVHPFIKIEIKYDGRNKVILYNVK